MLAATKTKAFRKGAKKDEPLGFRRETIALPLAGRVIRGGRFTHDGGTGTVAPLAAKTLRRLVEVAEEAARRLGAAIVAVPAGDPIESGELKDPGLDVLIGIRGLPASAEEPGPIGPIRLEELRAIVEDAQKRLDAAFWLAVGGALDPVREGLLVEAVTALHLVATGPRASGQLAFGIEARGAREGYAFFRGADMEASPHPLGVLGVVVAEVGAGRGGSAVIDLGVEAHAERASAAKALDGTLGYWVSVRHG